MFETTFLLPEHADHVQREWAVEAARTRLARVAATRPQSTEVSRSFAERLRATTQPTAPESACATC